MAFRIRALTSVLCITILTGCATIMHGTTQSVGISSNPSGATVTVNGMAYGRTPVIADLKRKDNHIVRLELSGYKPYETTLTRSTSGWVWGNIVIGGLVGLVIDAVGGGLYKLTPEQVSAQLEKGRVASAPNGDSLYIDVALGSDPAWEKVAQLQREE